MIEHLERAGLLLAGDDAAGSLAAILEAWRAVPSLELLPFVDRIAARIDVDPIGGANVKERHEAWLRRARARDPADLGVLLGYATAHRATREMARERFAALQRFPADPRIVSFYWPQRLERPPELSGRAMFGFWRNVIEYCVHTGDPRAWDEGMPDTPHPAVRALTGREERVLAEIDALLAKPRVHRGDETDLLAAIVKDPSDVGARLVYADVLALRGDPRAELIVLQCGERRDRGKEETLVRDRIADLLGPLYRIVEPEACVFSRGFLTEAKIVEPTADPTAVMDDPRWWTIETLTFGKIAHPHVAAIASRADALRSLQRIRAPHAVATHLPLHATSLELLDVVEADTTRRLFRGGGFPELRHVALRVESAFRLGTILETPVARRLLTMRLNVLRSLDPLENWLAHVPRDHPIEVITLDAAPAVLTLSLVGGVLDALDVVLKTDSFYEIRRITRVLAQVPRFLRRVTLTTAKGVHVAAPIFARVRTLLLEASPKTFEAD